MVGCARLVLGIRRCAPAPRWGVTRVTRFGSFVCGFLMLWIPGLAPSADFPNLTSKVVGPDLVSQSKQLVDCDPSIGFVGYDTSIGGSTRNGVEMIGCACRNQRFAISEETRDPRIDYSPRFPDS